MVFDFEILNKSDMDAYACFREDAYKRKLKKIKVKEVMKPFQFSFPKKAARFKLLALKLLLLFIVIATFFMVISSPVVCRHNNATHTVSRYVLLCHFMCSI